MQLICVSRGSLGKGIEFAEDLAAKLDVACLGRESLVELATAEGIAVGKLEMAIVRRRHLDERLALEKEHYLAFATRVLCEKALEGSLLYHGRFGHLVLPGLHHVLRVRVVADMESRIGLVMQRLRLSRARAKEYIETVEEDRRRWVRALYNVDWEEARQHDLIVNVEKVSVPGAATALCDYSQLPEFQSTPSAVNALENLLLAARARIALARNELTWTASFQVRANAGVLSVTYLPRDAAIAAHAPDVLSALPGVRDLSCAMASTNILWIQERFDPESPTLTPLVQIAQRWNAAVELLKVIPVEGDAPAAVASAAMPLPPPAARRAVDGGVEDDVEEGTRSPTTDRGIDQIYHELGRQGVASSVRQAPVNPFRMSSVLDRTVPYSLIVVGDVFLDKGHAARTRMVRELVAELTDACKVPVIKAEELKSQYLVGTAQYVTAAVYALVTFVLFLLVFHHQKEVLTFLSPSTVGEKVIAAASLMVFIPVIAYLYGSLARTILKLVHIE